MLFFFVVERKLFVTTVLHVTQSQQDTSIVAVVNYKDYRHSVTENTMTHTSRENRPRCVAHQMFVIR